MAFLLDTDVAVHLRDTDPFVRSRIAGLQDLPSISAVTRVELEGGVYANPILSAKRRRAIDVMLRDFAVLDFTSDIGAVYGQIIASAGFSRRKVAARMIAATALHHDLTLITLNGRDFRDVPGLRLVEWERPG
ncbi:PIN domain-containing protein [Leptolyngbya sp. 15MV]|nr:PIN domain-containing protein [Leptolyngbya sp. 15MV]